MTIKNPYLIILVMCFLSCSNRAKRLDPNIKGKADNILANLKGPVKMVVEVQKEALSDGKNQNTKFDFQLIYQFKDDGNYSSIIDFNSDSIIDQTEQYYYDQSGLKIKEVTLGSKDTIVRIDTYQYSGNRCIGYQSTYVQEKFRTEATYKYDERNNVIEESLGSENDRYKGSKMTLNYDTNNNEIDVRTYKNDKILTRKVYAYNKNNDVILVGCYESGILKFAYKYFYDDYDKNQNWIKRRIFSNDVLLFTTTREITYY